MGTFADAIGRRAFRFRTSVIAVFQDQFKLVLVPILLGEILRIAVGQDSQKRDFVFFEEGNDAIIERVDGSDHVLLRLVFALRHSCVIDSTSRGGATARGDDSRR